MNNKEKKQQEFRVPMNYEHEYELLELRSKKAKAASVTEYIFSLQIYQEMRNTQKNCKVKYTDKEISVLCGLIFAYYFDEDDETLDHIIQVVSNKMFESNEKYVANEKTISIDCKSDYDESYDDSYETYYDDDNDNEEFESSPDYKYEYELMMLRCKKIELVSEYEYFFRLQIYHEMKHTQKNCKVKYTNEEINVLCDLIYNYFLDADNEILDHIIRVVSSKMFNSNEKYLADEKKISLDCKQDYYDSYDDDDEDEM